MPKLAIIIPLLGDVERLEATLVSVLENRPADCELLVVLNARYDDPYHLGDEVQFVQVRRGASLADCINAGIEQATAPVVHVLAAGCEVVEHWTASVLRQFKDPQVAAVSPLVLAAGDSGQIVTAGVGYRLGGATRHIGLGRPTTALGPWVAEVQGPSLLAAFYRKSALESLGGFDPRVGDDHTATDLAIRLKAQGLRTLLDPQSKVYAQASLLAGGKGSLTGNQGVLRRALGAEYMFLRHVPAGRWFAALAAHSLLVTGEFVRALPRPAALLSLAGRGLAWTQIIACRASRPQVQSSDSALLAVTSGAHGVPRPHTASQRAAKRHTV